MSDSLKTPTAIQEKVLAKIDEGRLVKRCQDLVRIRSIVEEDAAEVEVAAYIEKFFRDLGLEVNVSDLPEIPGIAKGPHPQVVVRLKGKGKGPILLTGGHMDTEPVVTPELWKHDPFSGDIEDGKIIGLGTVNMKQSIASFMEAFQAIVEAGIELEGDLLFMACSQEDAGMIGSKYAIQNWDKVGLGPLPDMFFDGDQSNNQIWSTSLGYSFYKLKTYGKCSHTSSQYTRHPSYDGFRQVNALKKMIKIINEIHDVKKNFEYERGTFMGDPQITLGKMETTYPGEGTRISLGVDSATLYFDVRFPPGMDQDTCLRDIQRIIYNLRIEDPDLQATVEPLPTPLGIRIDKPVPHTPNMPLLKALKLTHKQIFGEDLVVDHETNGTSIDRVVDWCRYAGSDITAWSLGGIPSLNYGAGIVPVMPDEYVAIDDLVKHCKASTLAIIEVLKVKDWAGSARPSVM